MAVRLLRRLPWEEFLSTLATSATGAEVLLAILPSLMADISGDVLAMPMESVVEIVAIDRRAVTTMHGKKVADVRGRVVSLVYLDEVFNWNGAPAEAIADGQTGGSESRLREADELTIVVVGEEGREIQGCTMG